jgi:hypothetical protein
MIWIGLIWVRDWVRDLYQRELTRAMSRCRVCGSSRDVALFDPRGLWAYVIRNTYCPEHCPDHEYTYSRYDGHYCSHCGREPDPDWFCD